jgi:hypothetical protein
MKKRTKITTWNARNITLVLTLKKREQNNCISSTNDDALGANSEINHIKEIFHFLDGKEKLNEISTELCIQGHKDNKTKISAFVIIRYRGYQFFCEESSLATH